MPDFIQFFSLGRAKGMKICCSILLLLPLQEIGEQAICQPESMCFGSFLQHFQVLVHGLCS
ncbi:MAG: hypothetical protein IKH84_01755 [Ottowia sp.]|nr:hypothetical protein [Ottowia sp.]